MAILNGAPLVNFLGTRDNTGSINVLPQENYPQFLTKIFSFAEIGPTEPLLIAGPAIGPLYGWETVDEIGKYYSHQTALAVEMLDGSMTMFQRVVPEDAKKASVTIYLIIKKVSDYRIKKRYSTGKTLFPVERYDDEVDGVINWFRCSRGYKWRHHHLFFRHTRWMILRGIL